MRCIQFMTIMPIYLVGSIIALTFWQTILLGNAHADEVIQCTGDNFVLAMPENDTEDGWKFESIQLNDRTYYVDAKKKIEMNLNPGFYDFSLYLNLKGVFSITAFERQRMFKVERCTKIRISCRVIPALFDTIFDLHNKSPQFNLIIQRWMTFEDPAQCEVSTEQMQPTPAVLKRHHYENAVIQFAEESRWVKQSEFVLHVDQNVTRTLERSVSTEINYTKSSEGALRREVGVGFRGFIDAAVSSAISKKYSVSFGSTITETHGYELDGGKCSSYQVTVLNQIADGVIPGNKEYNISRVNVSVIIGSRMQIVSRC